MLAVAHQDVLDHPAQRMLHRLALAGDDHRGRHRHALVERREGGPEQRTAEAEQDQQPAQSRIGVRRVTAFHACARHFRRGSPGARRAPRAGHPVVRALLRRRRGALVVQGGEHLVALAVQVQLAGVQRQQAVGATQHAGPVGDQQHRAATRLERLDRRQQRLLAAVVEVRVGFVEHHQGRRTVQRPGQGDALALAAGKPAPPTPSTVS